MDTRELAISNCNREPIHIPGCIQPFGALIATDQKLEYVSHASTNLEAFLGVSGQDALGQAVPAILNEQVTHNLRNGAGHPTITSQRECVGSYVIGHQTFDVSLHRSDNHYLIELEKIPAENPQSQAAFVKARLLLARLQETTDTSSLLQLAVEDLQWVTGFDRVMAYQFLPDGAGEVVAEVKNDDLDPYLGLRYPASDIPEQVRAIALKMPIRAIADIQDQPADLLAADPERAPLDLSLTHVRAVSPIHVEYLANMGVQSAMNLAIIVRGKLWGLIAFHHNSSKLLSPDYRTTCELFGQLFSLKLQQVLEEERFNTRKRNSSALSQVANELKTSSSFTQTVTALGSKLCTLLSAQGMAVVSQKGVEIYQEAPSQKIVLELVQQVLSTSAPDLVPFETLRQLDQIDLAQLGKSAGALVLGISPIDQVFVIFFRNEIIYDVRWAGSPKKEIVQGSYGPRLQPRASFAEYRETVVGQCQPWSSTDSEVALELRMSLMQLLAIRQGDVQQQDWLRQQRQQDLLIAELNHRVKNILALVRSISRQTRESTATIEEYTVLLDRRIAALAYAHDLIAGEGLEWPSLHTLLSIEFRPYLADKDQQVSMAGAEVGLKANFVPMFALVIHELVTNSAKYGALSVSTGKVDIRWMEQDGGLAFYWRESGGPGVFPPKRRGFGRTLIERAIPFEFEGEASIRFPISGVQVDFWLPEHLILLQADEHEGSTHPTPDLPPQEKENIAHGSGRVLIVEDNMLLALEMENTLKSLDFTQIDTAPRVKQAFKLLNQEDYILGILDVNLKDENSFVVAEQLLDRQIPFLFATGYDSNFIMPAHLSQMKMLKKPIDKEQLDAAIQVLLA